MDYLLLGILIGLLFGLPVGAVGTMTVQRTWSNGIKAGLFTGLGSSAADCFYAAIGVFGLTLISDLLLKYQNIIHFFGGMLILFMGIRLLIRKDEAAPQKGTAEGMLKMFLSSFAVGITNPAAILTFLFAFSYFGISAGAGLFRGSMLLIGVLTGTYIWWGTLTAVTYSIKKKAKRFRFRYMNRIFGSILLLFGIIVLFLSGCSGIQNGSSTERSIDNSTTEESMVEKMTLQIGNSSFTATLESNAAVDALVDMIREAPVVIQMSDYSGFEKVGSLGTSLPASNQQTTTQSGDIVLYNGNQVVIFYGSNSWRYTRLGRIDDLSGWEDALGSGDVTVIFSLK